MTYREAEYNLLKFAVTTLTARFFLFMAGTAACIWGALTVDQMWGKAALWVFVPAIQGILWLGCFQHRQRLRDLGNQAPYNPLNHYVEVCEGCSPVKMADGHSPIKDIIIDGVDVTLIWYWAAFKSIKREDAAKQVSDSYWGPKIKAHHEHYLAKPEFNRP